MSGLTVNIDWQPLDQGDPEERSCFAAIDLRWNEISLMEGHDTLADTLRIAPYLSGYHLAEWIAWNWWRLRWEPRTDRPDWGLAHRLSTIGSGYVWPDIEIFSDGKRAAIIAKPTNPGIDARYRYIQEFAAISEAGEYETAIDGFIKIVLAKLRADRIEETNLDRLWRDVGVERNDPTIAQQRRFEALLGAEPGEADEDVLQQLLEDAKALGESAMNEIAAHHDNESTVLTALALEQQAARTGFDVSKRDGYQLPGQLSGGGIAAWKLGAETAGNVRQESGLGDGSVSDAKLEELAALRGGALQAEGADSRIAFALDGNGDTGRVIFRSKWKTGRRFELARILGDRLMTAETGTLFPSTRASTYRQKMQRAFAAELLCPFDILYTNLDGDFSGEAQQEMAEYFEVSPFTVRTSLVNRGLLAREDIETDFEILAA